MDHHDGPDFMHRHCDPSVRARTRRSVEKDVTVRARTRAAPRPTARPRNSMTCPGRSSTRRRRSIVKRAMDRKVVKDAQRQANMLSRLKQGARAPLGVAVAEALRTTKDAADAEFRASRGRKPRQLGLSTPGLRAHDAGSGEVPSGRNCSAEGAGAARGREAEAHVGDDDDHHC